MLTIPYTQIVNMMAEWILKRHSLYSFHEFFHFLHILSSFIFLEYITQNIFLKRIAPIHSCPPCNIHAYHSLMTLIVYVRVCVCMYVHVCLFKGITYSILNIYCLTSKSGKVLTETPCKYIIQIDTIHSHSFWQHYYIFGKVL